MPDMGVLCNGAVQVMTFLAVSAESIDEDQQASCAQLQVPEARQPLLL